MVRRQRPTWAKKRASRPQRFPGFELLEDRRMLAVAWRSPADSLDIDANGDVAPRDALLVIEDLNNNGSRKLPDLYAIGSPFIDASGDQFVAPLDALLVINQLNEFGPGRRTLQEQVTLDQEALVTVTVGQATGARVYQVQLTAAFDRSVQGPILEDLLAVYVVDAADTSRTILDRGTQGTAVFTWAGDVVELAEPITQWDGSVLTIDLSSIDDRDTAVLKFQ